MSKMTVVVPVTDSEKIPMTLGTVDLMMPPACPVEIHVFFSRALGLSLRMPPACPVEAHVSELRVSWQLSKRETPLGKPVASPDASQPTREKNVKTPLGKPVASRDSNDLTKPTAALCGR